MLPQFQLSSLLKNTVNNRLNSSVIGVSLILLFFILDYYTKLYISKYLAVGSGFTVIKGFFNIVNVHNSGIAFGAFADLPHSLRFVLFSGISLIVFIVVLYLIMFGKDKSLTYIVGLSLLGGGDLGNLYGRLFKGYVVDFLDFHIGQYHYPAFNLADSFITIGLIILVGYKFFNARRTS